MKLLVSSEKSEEKDYPVKLLKGAITIYKKIQSVKELENYKIAEVEKISIEEMDDKFEDLRKQSKKTKKRERKIEKRQKNKEPTEGSNTNSDIVFTEKSIEETKMEKSSIK